MVSGRRRARAPPRAAWPAHPANASRAAAALPAGSDLLGPEPARRSLPRTPQPPRAGRVGSPPRGGPAAPPAAPSEHRRLAGQVARGEGERVGAVLDVVHRRELLLRMAPAREST